MTLKCYANEIGGCFAKLETILALFTRSIFHAIFILHVSSTDDLGQGIHLFPSNFRQILMGTRMIDVKLIIVNAMVEMFPSG